MQSRSGRCGRAEVLCINGLIAGIVLQLFGYVWRQRHISDLIEYFVKITVVLKAYDPVSVVENILDFTGHHTLAERKSVSRFGFLARACKAHPASVGLMFEKQKFHHGAGRNFGSVKAGRNDFGVV